MYAYVDREVLWPFQIGGLNRNGNSTFLQYLSHNSTKKISGTVGLERDQNQWHMVVSVTGCAEQ